jgi:hypothetical protein
VAANDSSEEIFDASLRIEIQTANSRTTLWESPPPKKDNPSILKPGDSLEAPLLRYEIKEPGLHALSCSVSYWAQTRNLSFTPQPGAGERHMRSFKKLYKFQVRTLIMTILCGMTEDRDPYRLQIRLLSRPRYTQAEMPLLN